MPSSKPAFFKEHRDVTRRIRCFPPIIDQASRVLVLGSMPSVRSLRAGEYYGHPQNQFWIIMAALLGVGAWRDYEHKKATVLQYGIALWDVIDSCRREGSADANITNARVNDLPGLLKRYPNIRAVACDSGTAHTLLIRFYPRLDVPVLKLPSPSRAYPLPLSKKLEQWKAILAYLS